MGAPSEEFSNPIQTKSIESMDLITNADNVKDLSEVCEDICSAEGFTHYAIMECPDKNVMGWEDVGLLSNWPQALIKEYDENNLLPESPIFAHLNESTQPLVFNVDEINRNRPDGKSQSAASLLHRNGINAGVLLSAHLANGIAGGVLFCSDSVDPTRAQLVRLHFLANMLFSRAYGLMAHSDQGGQLAEIELKSLQLTSAGKSCSDISNQLDLSAFTIHRYLNNAAKKLGASTLPEAVGIAIRLKLIS